MKPLRNNIIVEPIEYDKRPSGLYIKATSTEKLTAKVIAVGNKAISSIGDTVQYRGNVGTKLDFDGKKLLHLNESHVIAII